MDAIINMPAFVKTPREMKERKDSQRKELIKPKKKKAAQVNILRKDGMTACDACKVVGISLNFYYFYRNKKAP